MFVFFFFDEGRKDSITTFSGPSTARQGTPFKWRFAGGPMVAQHWILACKLMLRNPIFLWLGRDPLSPPLDPHMFMYLSICINPFIRNCVWKVKLKSNTRKNSYETKVTTMNEMMQHYWLTLYLRVALTLCMLSHDDIIQRALENAGHRKRQVNTYIYVQDRRIFFCFPQLTYQRMLISYKVQCRTIR